MIDYFGKIEIRYDKKETTTFSLHELLRDVDCAKFEINSGLDDDYTNHKIIQHKLRKAQTLVDDTKKTEFQKIIDDNSKSVIDEECKSKNTKDDQDKLGNQMPKTPKWAYYGTKRI